MLFKIAEGKNVNIADIIKRVSDVRSDTLIYPLRYKFELTGIEFEDTGYFTELEDMDKLMRFVDSLCHDYTVNIKTVAQSNKRTVKCETSIREYLDAPVITISA